MSRKMIAVVALAGLSSCGPALADVTVLQQGVSPTEQYAGCKDTWIGNGPWGETRRNQGRAPTLHGASGRTVRNILMRFCE